MSVPIARTGAAGSGALDQRFVQLSSSLGRDQALLTEDLVGSAAHVCGLVRAGLVSAAEAAALLPGLWGILDAVRGGAALPEEEDIHMAVESLLSQRLGAVAGKLHTGRSRNDQIALDLHLHLREALRLAGGLLADLLEVLLDLGQRGIEAILPSYTHRQRAIPITVGHWALGGAAGLLRDGALLGFQATRMRACPLGAGAIAGSSLPLDRAYVAELLGYQAPSGNSLDTVGDRDAAADLAYLSARLHGHMGRIATDIIDFSTQEFGLVLLGDAIACGSSMMPHKRNPDLFELVRGRAAQALGDLVTELGMTQRLPLGYQRDLQEDRAVLTGQGPHLCRTLELLALGLRHVTFNEAAARAALAGDATQATDLAEVLVARGVPFRQAYRIVGELVQKARERGSALAALSEADLLAALPPAMQEVQAVVAALLARLDPWACVLARDIAGGPASAEVRRQLGVARDSVAELRRTVAAMPALAMLEVKLREMYRAGPGFVPI